MDLKSEMEPRREDFPEQHVYENEFSPDQQLWNQEENSGLEQEEPEPPLIKEEQEELCITQEGEQLVVKLEVEKGSQHVDSGSSEEEEEPKPKKRRLRTGSHHEEFQRMMGHQHRLLDITRKPVIKLHRIGANGLVAAGR
ncbi:uncharacterized protein KZ484_011856 isoform 2-T2 [Pholidichthys leucotaenia]